MSEEKFEMKATLLVCVAGLLLVTVFGTTPPECGSNMVPTNCEPCDKICNRKGPMECSNLCASRDLFCKCASDTCRPTLNSNYCVEE